MRELGATTGAGMLGCTQVSEILYTPGVTLVGALPGELALSTVYSVARVHARAAARGRAPLRATARRAALGGAARATAVSTA